MTHDLAVESYDCPTCGVPAGEGCVTVRGRVREPGGRLSWPHAARTRPLEQAWRDGYAAGAENGAYGRLTSLARMLEKTPNATVTFGAFAAWLRENRS